MSQEDRTAKKAKPAFNVAGGWGRHRMNEIHRKGRRAAKKQRRRAQRRAGKLLSEA